MRRKKINKDASLEDVFRTLSMRADKRLQRLEKYAQRPGYETLLKGAYARAMRDIEVMRGEGHKRFGRRPPENEFDLRAMINNMKAFLRSDTSTLKPGIDTQGFAVSKYESAADKFNRRYGGNFTWQEIASYYDTKKAQNIAAKIPQSKTVAKALGQFKRILSKNPNMTNKQLREAIRNNPNKVLTNEDAVNKVIKLMARQGLSPRRLFGEK